MGDRNDIDRDRERERSGRSEWDRGREWGREAGGRGREEWDRERERRFSSEGRAGEARYEDYERQRRGGDEVWRDTRYSGSERVADYGNRGDWGRQGSWGTYGNRPDYDRENYWREGRGQEPRRVESDFGGQNTGRTNLYGTGGGGFGTGMSSYGAGMGPYGAGALGGGMGTYGGAAGAQRERGRFAGRGPKGWRRSDDRIRDDISERLTDNPDVDASEIEVSVKDAEVTLTGTVDERHAKRLAEDIAESVSGVRDVNNQIRVQHSHEPAAGHLKEQMSNQGVIEQHAGTGTTGRSK